MTERQALTEARKRFGKNAAVRCEPRGGFIGDDGQWRESHLRVCEHGRVNDHCRTREFYVISRSPCEHCGNGTKYILGRMKYAVASYKVGVIDGVSGMRFFSIRADAETWEAAFRKCDPQPEAQAS